MDTELALERFDLRYKESRIDGAEGRRVLWERHCHSRYEMISVLEGDVSIMPEGLSYRLTAGETAIIPPLCYHTVTANRSGAYRRVTAHFELSAVPSVLRERFLASSEGIAVFSSDRADRLRAICEAEDPLFYGPLAESLMVELLYECAELAPQSVAPQTDEPLRQILAYIDAHLCERITLDGIAAHTARSKSAVSHLFAERMQISPKQYILQKKLALAVKLIRGGTPPTVAAMQVGYEDYSNFYRIYRKHYGVGPTGERREKRDGGT